MICAIIKGIQKMWNLYERKALKQTTSSLSGHYNVVNVVELLIQFGANVNAVGNRGYTTLILAAEKGWKYEFKYFTHV